MQFAAVRMSEAAPYPGPQRLLDQLYAVFDTTLTVAVVGLLVVASGFIALIGVNVLEAVRGRPLRAPMAGMALDESDLPHVLVQIPVFDEPEMVAGALRAAAALDWPLDRLHIQLLDDSRDETSAIAAVTARDLARRGVHIAHLRRDSRIGFKAGALAAGLAASDAPIVAILDADFRPPRDWLRIAVPALLADPGAGFVQSRCEFANAGTNLLTRVQGMMLDAHYVMEQATRYRAGWLFQFNGTGGIWRRAAIEAAGGWSADSLCEDLDLTVRAALAGWHGVFLNEPAVPGLVPERVGHWRVQQRRWSTGFVQVAHKLMRPIWSADWPLTRKLSATFLILVQAFYPSAGIATVSFVMCLILRGGDATPYLPLIVLIAALVALVVLGLTLFPYVTLKRGPLWRYFATIAALAPFLIYVSVSNTPSILQSVFGRRESFKRTPKTPLASMDTGAEDPLAPLQALPLLVKSRAKSNRGE
jgi:cellulose synthase/poly-beta-1,6-N-acetylglucosamine synthase-like glycosyltransferase